MLRSPNEIVTASKVSSANGSRVPSPAVNGSCGRACLPTCSMPSEKSHGTTVAPRSANGWLDVPVPAARSSTRSPGRGSTARDHVAAPPPVLAQREHVVGDVVAPGDGVEHPPYVGGLLVELCAGHARRLRGLRRRRHTRTALPHGVTRRDSHESSRRPRHHPIGVFADTDFRRAIAMALRAAASWSLACSAALRRRVRCATAARSARRGPSARRRRRVDADPADDSRRAGSAPATAESRLQARLTELGRRPPADRRPRATPDEHRLESPARTTQLR